GIDGTIKALIATGGAERATRVDVSTIDGHVVLLGIVSSPEARATVESTARGVAGATGVTNFLPLPEKGDGRGATRGRAPAVQGWNVGEDRRSVADHHYFAACFVGFHDTMGLTDLLEAEHPAWLRLETPGGHLSGNLLERHIGQWKLGSAEYETA